MQTGHNSAYFHRILRVRVFFKNLPHKTSTPKLGSQGWKWEKEVTV